MTRLNLQPPFLSRSKLQPSNHILGPSGVTSLHPKLSKGPTRVTSSPETHYGPRGLIMNNKDIPSIQETTRVFEPLY